MADSNRIEELKRRVQMDPASIAFAALAEEYRRAGRYEEAIATCEAGLQRHPAYLSARVTLGRALVELGRFADAREQLEHVLRVAPENLAAIRALAEIHDRSSDYPDPAPAEGAALSGPAFTPANVTEAPSEPAAGAPRTGPAGPRLVHSVRPVEPAPDRDSAEPELGELQAREPHPDEAALPALEALLVAVLAAKGDRRGDAI